MLKEQKGITLVALVITIIVLVILVGVTLSVTINSGLINNTNTAVKGYEGAQGNEMNHLNNVENMVQNYVDEYTKTNP